MLRDWIKRANKLGRRNLNDPDFNPIQEMIHLSIPRHMRRWEEKTQAT